MEYAKNEGMDWRIAIELWVTSELGHSVFNPNTESERYLKKVLPKASLRKLKFSNIDKFQSIVRGIVKIDSEEIAKRSDYVICYWDRSAQRGAGTKGELTVARLFGKPVYLVTRIQRTNIPGWILGCTSEIFSSFTELKVFLRKQYLNER
jgi:hypothetical protein